MEDTLAIKNIVILDFILNKLLVNEKGEEYSLPFSIKYKILFNKGLMEKDCKFFFEERNKIFSEVGENIKELSEEQKEELAGKLGDLLDKEASSSADFKKFNDEDLKVFKDNKSLSVEEMSLFIKYFVEE